LSKKKCPNKLIIASDDGNVYELSEDQLKPYKVKERNQNADHKRAKKLAANGANHAVWRSRIAFYAYAKFPPNLSLSSSDDE